MRERSWPPPGAWRFRHTRRRASRAFHHQHGIIEFISIIHAMYTTSRIRLASSADRSARGGRESVCSTHRPARVDYLTFTWNGCATSNSPSPLASFISVPQGILCDMRGSYHRPNPVPHVSASTYSTCSVAVCYSSRIRCVARLPSLGLSGVRCVDYTSLSSWPGTCVAALPDCDVSWPGLAGLSARQGQCLLRPFNSVRGLATRHPTSCGARLHVNLPWLRG